MASDDPVNQTGFSRLRGEFEGRLGGKLDDRPGELPRNALVLHDPPAHIRA